MRTSITVVGIGIGIGAVLQMGFLLNSDVVYGAYLSLLGALFGLFLGASIYLYKQRRNYQSMYVIEDYSGKLPWYKGVFQTELVVFMCVIFSMVAITLLNNIPEVFEPYEEEFQVASVGKRTVRYDQFEYIELTNGDVSVKYKTEHNGYVKGQEVTAILRKGLLGFPVVVEVVPSNG